jgi:hypothetical protein
MGPYTAQWCLGSLRLGTRHGQTDRSPNQLAQGPNCWAIQPHFGVLVATAHAVRLHAIQYPIIPAIVGDNLLSVCQLLLLAFHFLGLANAAEKAMVPRSKQRRSSSTGARSAMRQSSAQYSRKREGQRKASGRETHRRNTESPRDSETERPCGRESQRDSETEKQSESEG